MGVLALGIALRATPASPRDLLPEFKVPAGGVLRESVDFWLKIYGHYSIHQGVIHDSKYPRIIYQEYDFARTKDASGGIAAGEGPDH